MNSNNGNQKKDINEQRIEMLNQNRKINTIMIQRMINHFGSYDVNDKRPSNIYYPVKSIHLAIWTDVYMYRVLQLADWCVIR